MILSSLKSFRMASILNDSMKFSSIKFVSLFEINFSNKTNCMTPIANTINASSSLLSFIKVTIFLFLYSLSFLWPGIFKSIFSQFCFLVVCFLLLSFCCRLCCRTCILSVFLVNTPLLFIMDVCCRLHNYIKQIGFFFYL